MFLLFFFVFVSASLLTLKGLSIEVLSLFNFVVSLCVFCTCFLRVPSLTVPLYQSNILSAVFFPTDTQHRETVFPLATPLGSQPYPRDKVTLFSVSTVPEVLVLLLYERIHSHQDLLVTRSS